jgi:dipeptidyl aminopeptidase/acylaminoacyl peptidase
MIRSLSRLLFVALVPAIAAPAVRAELPPLIPRRVLLADSARSSPRLSPDGSQLAYVGPSDKGVPNLWVQTLGKHDDRLVTHDARRGIRGFTWAADSRHLLYRQDRDGDENWHVFSTDLTTGLVRDLTPFVGIRAQDLLVSSRRPGEILVGLNTRDRRVSDMYRVNLDTGAVTLDTQNPGDVLSWVTDDDFVIRAATAFDAETARSAIRVRDNGSAPWRDLVVLPFEHCPFFGQVNGGSLVAGFSPGGKGLYAVLPLDSDKTRLVELDLKTGKPVRAIASDPRCDVEYSPSLISSYPDVLTSPADGHVQAVGFNYTRLEWNVVDDTVRADFDALGRTRPGTLYVIDRVRDDSLWLVAITAADGPAAYYLYDRPRRKADLLFLDPPDWGNYTFARPEPVVIKARDGLDLVCYLTAPPGVPRKGLPLVLLPHGGPWWRDRLEFDPWVQLLANRGYAVLQVEYRGSTGFGMKFFNAANRQFGDQAVLADLLDGVRCAVDTGLADPKRLGVLGGSGGGYATLCCLAFHPELWACGIDVVGPSNVATLMEGFPPFFKAVKRRWVLRMGDAEHDEAWNRKISPLFHADRIRAPLLMFYGLNDARVTIREAEQMVQALRARDRPVTLVVYPDEGHGFSRRENNLDFFGRMEEFLAKHLGGRQEPRQPVPGSTAEVR